MKKLRLDLDELCVDSFGTADERTWPGTVAGFDSGLGCETVTSACEIESCGFTCRITCASCESCEVTCETGGSGVCHDQTCAPACD
ncbi:MAG TPA: hypothetical protein VFQ39_13335 [Longimicrobium sp.]|nr:hypothetical protein [Longimicrobium sp.]